MAVTNAQLAQYALATFGIAPGGFNTLLGDFANANGEVGLLNALLKLSTSPFGNVTDNGAFSSLLVENVIGSTATSANKNWLVTLITSNLDAGASRGQMVKALVDALAKVPSTDANWGTSAATFANKSTVAEYYTTKGGASTDLAVLTGVVKSVTSDAATVTSAKSGIDNGYAGYAVQALTSATDTVVGTSGNDMITSALGTWDPTASKDRITDTSSTDADVLNATVDGTVTPASGMLSGIETINLTAKFGTVTFGAANVSGTKQLNIDSAVAYGSAEVTNAGATSIAAVKAGTNVSTLKVTNGTSSGATAVDAGSAATVTLTGNATADDAFALTLNGGATALTTATLTGTNDKVTITGKTAANTITLTTGAKTIVAAGDQDMTISAASGAFDGNTVTNSLSSGKLLTAKVTSAAAVADLSKVAASTLQLDAGFATTTGFTVANNANIKLNTTDEIGRAHV